MLYPTSLACNHHHAFPSSALRERRAIGAWEAYDSSGRLAMVGEGCAGHLCRWGCAGSRWGVRCLLGAEVEVGTWDGCRGLAPIGVFGNLRMSSTFVSITVVKSNTTFSPTLDEDAERILQSSLACCVREACPQIHRFLRLYIERTSHVAEQPKRTIFFQARLACSGLT